MVVVAVDGPSGAGKTTLADAVAAELGCAIVHVDAFYPGWDGLAAGVRLLATRVLAPLATGRRASFPVWDWQTGAWAPGEVPVDPPASADGRRYLVVEGCGSSALPAGAYAAVRVWLDAPAAVRRARGLARDGEAYAPFWDRWAAQEQALFAADRTRTHADLVFEADA